MMQPKARAKEAPMSKSERFVIGLLAWGLVAAFEGNCGGATTPADAIVRVSAPAADVMRVQLSPVGQPPPSVTSFAVDPTALSTPVPVTVEEDGGVTTYRTAAMGVRVSHSPLRVDLIDASGAVVAGLPSPVAFSPRPSVTWTLGPSTHVYGLGDKVKSFDRRGQRYTLWNFAPFSWDESSDPLYKSIPFLLFLDVGRAHGLFIDNPARASVDVGASDHDRLLYEADRAPEWDLYLFAGPAPKDVLAAYTKITGRMPLPPRWALGYHQSRWSYMSEAEARAVAGQLRSDQVPADAIWLDIDFQQDFESFTVNSTTFPNFGPMVADLLAENIHTVVITDPGIKRQPGYAPYDSGEAANVFVQTDGGSEYVGEVWPGACVFPDFSLTRVRVWWGELYQPFVGQGVAGFWNDMNEPDIFLGVMPDDTPHRLDDGTTFDEVTAHNTYGLLNARATHDGLMVLRPAARPFVLTRAAYAGAQRWAASWTGDNTATRSHLAVTIPQLLNLGVSGYSFVGADVGGFFGCPDPDLLTEWTELGAFQPFFRNHSAQGTCRREPWANGTAQEARIRAAIERRYRLLPYLYTVFEEAARTGLPVMRALWLEYPADTSTYTNDRTFLFGHDLLVAPKLVAGTVPWQVTLPAADWWDTSNGLFVPGGGEVTVTPAAEESVRLFARAGAIIPQQPVTQSADVAPSGPLTLDVWPGGQCSGALYLDAGDGYGYETGDLRRVAFACVASASGISVSSSSVGAFATWWSSTYVVVHGVPRTPTAVASGGLQPSWQYDSVSQTLTVMLPGDAADWALTANW
jgi:alpha-glucosidase